MRPYRCFAATLLVPVLVAGLALSAPPPAYAGDTDAFIGGAIVGALLSGAFDRDYPPGSLTFGRGYGQGGRGGFYGYCARGYGCGDERPVWFYYPEAGVFAFPGFARPYPYGIRWWQFAGRYRGRLVFVPAMYQGWGGREALRFPAQRPIFVLPTQQYAGYGGYPGYGGYGGWGYGWQPYGAQPPQMRDWEPSPTLQYYRPPTQGWRRDWDPQRDGWYDLEAKQWRRAEGSEDVKGPGAPGKKRQPPGAVSQRAEADQTSDEPSPGPPQKAKPKLDESWRSEMRPALEGEIVTPRNPGGPK